ncbi:MAG TPA: hypothetical protein DD723_03005 [Candidatus Omnitrophica bacterium]|nr:MAG: hypothetical protein A2Z81_01270 [Omnitrophica WOR_2 bacterium GWA2_45_18]HBR14497.1 hypothetical protein [Candidatus Omnitrophota bacterium]
MTCSRGKASLNTHTKLRLFADSAGYCQNPSCNDKLFVNIGDGNIHIAEMAHIISAGDKGPRANKKMSKEERGKYKNLILLCANCHTKVDKAEKEYPDHLILEWKKSHIQKVKDLFGAKEYSNREEVRALIEPILSENRTIFDTYGPLTDERFNPESELPEIWKRKIKSIILPNNRKLLMILDANRNLLNQSERYVLERFKQHVDDFEAKHLGGSDLNGIQFPQEMNHMCGEDNGQ